MKIACFTNIHGEKNYGLVVQEAENGLYVLWDRFKQLRERITASGGKLAEGHDLDTRLSYVVLGDDTELVLEDPEWVDKRMGLISGLPEITMNQVYEFLEGNNHV